MKSGLGDENEICDTSKGRTTPPAPLPTFLSAYDEDYFSSSSWANTNDDDDDPIAEEIDEGLFHLPDSSTDLHVSRIKRRTWLASKSFSGTSPPSCGSVRFSSGISVQKCSTRLS